MTADQIETVRPDAELKQVADVMQRAQVRRVPVVEPDGRIVGVIAQADVAVKGGSSAKMPTKSSTTRLSAPSGHGRGDRTFCGT